MKEKPADCPRFMKAKQVICKLCSIDWFVSTEICNLFCWQTKVFSISFQ
jgi:hypothetical protein